MAQNARKPFGGRDSAPDPARELTTLPDPLVGGEGLSPKNPSSAPCPSDLAPSFVHPQCFPTWFRLAAFLSGALYTVVGKMLRLSTKIAELFISEMVLFYSIIFLCFLLL